MNNYEVTMTDAGLKLQELIKDKFRTGDRIIQPYAPDYLLEDDYNTVEDMDTLELLKEKLQESRGFIYDNDMIGYYESTKYILENDPSMNDCLELASEMGFTLENLSSESLATLLWQSKLQETFNELWDDVENEMQEYFDSIE